MGRAKLLGKQGNRIHPEPFPPSPRHGQTRQLISRLRPSSCTSSSTSVPSPVATADSLIRSQHGPGWRRGARSFRVRAMDLQLLAAQSW